MKVTIDVPDYDTFNGLTDNWTGDFRINVSTDNGEVAIFANEDGLVSLATHLLALAQINVPSGYHLHFSESYGLQNGSNDLILGKN